VSRRLTAVVFFCAAIGISLALSVQGLRAKVSAQDLLREAAREGGPLEDIFSQQAGQGYYDDALATARLAASDWPHPEYELAGYADKLIQIRGENGDIRGAKEMIKQLNDSVLGGKGPQVTLEIAKIQIDHDDLRGALESCASPEDRNAVIEAFGEHQIEKGDFNGGLKTAEQLGERSAYNLFYDIGDALRQRGEQDRLHELASHMRDKKRAAEFVEAARFTLYTRPVQIEATPCDIAISYAGSRKFTEAWNLVDQNNCPFSSFIAVNQYANDPVEAEQELRKRTDNVDVSRGLRDMGEVAAQKGDISNAVRLLDSARQVSADQGFRLDCVRRIAWARTLRDDPRIALGWAHSLPVQQRGFALLGIAQALGRARPD
jgi:hypothetical protein